MKEGAAVGALIAWGMALQAVPHGLDSGPLLLWLTLGAAATLMLAPVEPDRRLWAFSGYAGLGGLVWLYSERAEIAEPVATWVLVSVFALLGAVGLWQARRELRALWPLAAWGLLVFFFSGEAGGAGRMFRFATEVMGLSESAAEWAVQAVRKGVHVGYYGVLAALAWRSAWHRAPHRARAACFALVWALAHACLDELRQAASPGRTGTAWDVLLDMVGAALAVGIVAWRTRRPG